MIARATITAATSLSSICNLTGQIAGIVIPSAWTAASITFQFSMLGTTFEDVYDTLGNEITIASASIPTASNRYIDFTSGSWSPAWYAAGYIKIRSGSSASPVVQAADRLLLVNVIP